MSRLQNNRGSSILFLIKSGKKLFLVVLVLSFFALALPNSSFAAIRTVTSIKKVFGLKASISVDYDSKLKWTKISKVKYYRVQLKKKNGTRIKTWTKRSKNWVKIESRVKAGKKYKYRVRGCKGDRCGKWSKYKYFNTEDLGEEVEEDVVDDESDEESVSSDCNYNKYNCSDFDYQSEAQYIYDKCMVEVGRDIHDLERDGDGMACDSLK